MEREAGVLSAEDAAGRGPRDTSAWRTHTSRAGDWTGLSPVDPQRAPGGLDFTPLVTDQQQLFRCGSDMVSKGHWSPRIVVTEGRSSARGRGRRGNQHGHRGRQSCGGRGLAQPSLGSNRDPRSSLQEPISPSAVSAGTGSSSLQIVPGGLPATAEGRWGGEDA